MRNMDIEDWVSAKVIFMHKALWPSVSSVTPDWQRLLASSTGFAGQPTQTIVNPPQGSAVLSAQPTVEAKASGRKELPAVCDLPLQFCLGCIMLITFIMSTKCICRIFSLHFTQQHLLQCRPGNLVHMVAWVMACNILLHLYDSCLMYVLQDSIVHLLIGSVLQYLCFRMSLHLLTHQNLQILLIQPMDQFQSVLHRYKIFPISIHD